MVHLHACACALLPTSVQCAYVHTYVCIACMLLIVNSFVSSILWSVHQMQPVLDPTLSH